MAVSLEEEGKKEKKISPWCKAIGKIKKVSSLILRTNFTSSHFAAVDNVSVTLGIFRFKDLRALNRSMAFSGKNFPKPLNEVRALFGGNILNVTSA